MRDRVLRAIRREGYKMTRQERAALMAEIDATGVYFFPVRQGKRHRSVYGYGESPLCHGLHGWTVMQDGAGRAYLVRNE